MKIQLCLVGNYLEKHIKFDEFKNLIYHEKNTRCLQDDQPNSV